MKIKRIEWQFLTLVLAAVLLVVGCGQTAKPGVAQKGKSDKSAQVPAAGAVEAISEADFDARVLQSPVPVLVDFWAPWCGPCQTQGPIIEQIAARYGAKLKAVRINMDSAKTTATRYHIVAIPALMLFRDGKIVLNRTGLTSEAELVGMLDKVL